MNIKSFISRLFSRTPTENNFAGITIVDHGFASPRLVDIGDFGRGFSSVTYVTDSELNIDPSVVNFKFASCPRHFGIDALLEKAGTDLNVASFEVYYPKMYTHLQSLPQANVFQLKEPSVEDSLLLIFDGNRQHDLDYSKSLTSTQVFSHFEPMKTYTHSTFSVMENEMQYSNTIVASLPADETMHFVDINFLPKESDTVKLDRSTVVRFLQVHKETAETREFNCAWAVTEFKLSTNLRVYLPILTYLSGLTYDYCVIVENFNGNAKMDSTILVDASYMGTSTARAGLVR